MGTASKQEQLRDNALPDSHFKKYIESAMRGATIYLLFFMCTLYFGTGTSISDVNGLDIPKQNEAVHPKKSKRAEANSKTEKMREKIKQLRKNFKLLDETKPKEKVGEKCKRKKKGKKKTKSCRRKQKRKSRGGKRLKNKARYYLENGKYKRNEKFDSWANEVTKMWKKVKRDSSCSCGLPSVDRTRIVNGAEAKAHSYPWIIAMMTGRGEYYCGGSIISNQWILTAAHCVSGEPNNPAKDMYVRLGDHDMTDKGDAPNADTFQVDYYIHHSNYNEETTNNDIALLKLKKKIDFKKYSGTVAPVCLPDLPRKYYGETVTVSGWGLLSDGGKAAKKLQEVDLEIIWMKECREDFHYKKSWISSKMMCTFKQNSDACQGDSGGPLVRVNPTSGRYEQVGVVSWGIGCASPKYPGVFVKLSHYLSWILKKTSKSTFCSR